MESEPRSHFIRTIVEQDLKTDKYGGRVATRFPPEPNGYLHIGHCKAICLDFGMAADYGGTCNLRFDDTNPEKEDVEYVEAIQRDIRWLGFDWGDRLYYASGYFEQLHDYAVQLIRDGLAYVCSLNEAEIREYRGTVTEAGRNSPYRDRSVEDNLDLFARMRAGEFDDGAHVVRLKIDMASANMKMRDPLIYRIRKITHHRTGDAWCIYPMYDFAHCLSDSLEGITHSLCSLEFENNRELYDWILEHTRTPPHPQQIEFARLAMTHTVMSKRRLRALVEAGVVSGWDDPRMPTLAAYRRSGYTPTAIRTFIDRVGMAKANSVVDVGQLEFAIRDELNQVAPRVMCVLRPLRVVLTNYPEGQTEQLDAPYFPHDIGKEGSRQVPFGRVLYIERDDFMEAPPKGYYRLAPGREVRLRYGYFIRCDEVVRNDAGEVVELRCTYDPETRGGSAPDGRRVKGTIHWVSAEHALPAEVRLFERLFVDAQPDGDDFRELINPESLVVWDGARVEPSVAADSDDTRYQFERQGYFWRDPVDSRPDRLVFNRIVSLRDSWAKSQTVAAPAPKKKKSQAKPKTSTKPASAPRRPSRSPALEARATHYGGTLGLSPADVDILTSDGAIAAFFDAAVAAHDHPKAIANWVVNEVLRETKDTPIDALPFGGDALGALVALVDEGAISGKIAKTVFAEMLAGGGDPRSIVDAKGLRQLDDADALQPIIDEVVAANPDKVAQYQGGNKRMLGFFVGQVMRQTQGRANPVLVNELLGRAMDS